MCRKFEDALDKAKVLTLLIIIGAILSSCSSFEPCSTYGQSNQRTKYGVKSQQHWAKKNKIYKHSF